jgi:hypothetical protein
MSDREEREPDYYDCANCYGNGCYQCQIGLSA